MNIKHILGLALAAVMAVSCADDNEPGVYGNIAQDDAFVILDASGSSSTITVKAVGEWQLDSIFSLSCTVDGQKVTKHFPLPVKLTSDKTDGEPSWLTVSQVKGVGETQLTFSAPSSNGGRECELRLTVDGKKQFIKVRQGSMEATPSTCAEIIAGPDSKTYRVTGTVTAIANTTYGNWYLEDATGQVYIYGTLDKNGATKNFASLGIEVGDVVTVEGPKTTYNGTVELVDVTVLKIVKSLLKVVDEPVTIGKEGGEFTVKVAFKGVGANVSIPSEAQQWLMMKSSRYIPGLKTIYDTATPADTTEFTFTVAANDGAARQADLEFTSSTVVNSSTVAYTVKQEANVLPHGESADDPFTIAEAIAKCEAIGSTSDGVIYYAKGYISSISSIDTGDYGNATFNISDDGTEAGALTVFRSYYLDNAKFTAADQIAVGDEVIICGKLVNYKGTTPEFSGNVYVVSQKKSEPGTLLLPFSVTEAIAKCQAIGSTSDGVIYYAKGKVSSVKEISTSYGNATFNISVDGTESNVLTVFRAKGFGNESITDAEIVKVGDEVVVCGKLVNYKGETPEFSGNVYIVSVNGKTE